MNPMLALRNGPCNGRKIKDRGQAVVLMAIYQTGKPVVGELTGHAVYERHQPDRREAFWLENVWLGTFEGTIPA